MECSAEKFSIQLHSTICSLILEQVGQRLLLSVSRSLMLVAKCDCFVGYQMPNIKGCAPRIKSCMPALKERCSSLVNVNAEDSEYGI